MTIISMNIGDFEIRKTLRQIVDSTARYRLAVLKSDDSMYDESVLNVGRELAECIERIEKQYKQSSIKFQIEVSDALEKLIASHTVSNECLGPIVTLRNIGILFEKDLHIDVVGLLQRISRTTLTVLMWQGEADEQRLYFLRKGSKITINQSDINYTII